MANTKARPNEEWDVRFGPITVDLTVLGRTTIGTANDDSDHIVVESVNVLAKNINGTPSATAVATVDTGTNSETIASSTTFTSLVEGKATKMAIPANFYVIPDGDAESNVFAFNVTTAAVGQATTFRARNADNIATVTTAAAHGLAAGDLTQVSSLGGTGYNGKVVVITAPTTTTFTYYSDGPTETSTADTAGRVGIYEVDAFINATYMGDLNRAS